MAASLDSVFQRLDETSPVELLMLGCNPNQANQFAIALRNAGQAVHVETAETEPALLQLLETEPGDLVAVNADSRQLPKQTAIDVVRAANPSTSIILLSRDPAALIGFAAEQDLRDVLQTDDTEHLAFVVQREHQNLLLRQELANLRHQLQESERRFDSLMGKSRDAIAYVHEGMHIDANAVYCEMFGIPDMEDIEGLPLMDLVAPDARQKFKKVLRNQANNDSFSAEVECQTTDGKIFDAVMEFSPAQLEGEPCTQIVIRDQSMQDELQARIDELANRDAQTHLFNRQAFMERLEDVLSSNSLPSGAGLVQVSINNFSELSDKSGIEQSDQLLASVAEILTHQIPDAHTLARFGDHDFIALIDRPEALTETAERCLGALNRHDFFDASGVLDAPTFSVGVAPCPDAARISAYELVNRSCRATKQAHEDVHDELVIFTEPPPEPSSEPYEADTSTVALIDHALQNDRFHLVYQAVVSLQGDTRESYAVYLRLIDQDGQEHSLENVWSQAQKSNRLAEIDRWVVRNAIKELARLRDEGKKINFQLLLSRDGIADESMLLWVCDCLREFKAKGAWLTFQFNEEDLRNNLQPALKLIDGLKKINCRIGINYNEESSSTETLLNRLPVDVVRLAAHFMDGLASNEQKQNKLNQLNARLQSDGYRTIATGVEDANTLAMLWNIGVNCIQGNFLSEPSDTITFEEDR
jgi:diguanylate cyclase (GGDEF)-like protein/PAS domain S-box-containing protein